MGDGIREIIDSLERQKSAIENALDALRQVSETGAQTTGRATATGRSAGPAKRKGGMTPEGRRRLAEAMKRRWAAKRAASAVKKRGPAKKKAA